VTELSQIRTVVMRILEREHATCTKKVQEVTMTDDHRLKYAAGKGGVRDRNQCCVDLVLGID